MSNYCKLLLTATVITFFGNSYSEDPICGQWVPYKEEKCIKIFDSMAPLSYKDAERFCQQQANGYSLVSIRYSDENEFIKQLIKNNNIANDVWIGVKYLNTTYKLADSSEAIYTNWANGSPKNLSDHCVQISSDETSFGKWSDVLCNKNNLVACERTQTWSLSYLQSLLLNTIKNPFPVGFIYVQLPKESPPTDIWPWMIWNDVSSSYAGVFFRVSGERAADFGQIQTESAPRITDVASGWNKIINVSMNGICDQNGHSECNASIPIGNWSPYTYSGANDGGDHRLIRFLTSSDEVRPRNMAIRVWKRVN